jgi:hypothetical protein
MRKTIQYLPQLEVSCKVDLESPTSGSEPDLCTTNTEPRKTTINLSEVATLAPEPTHPSVLRGITGLTRGVVWGGGVHGGRGTREKIPTPKYIGGGGGLVWPHRLSQVQGRYVACGKGGAIGGGGLWAPPLDSYTPSPHPPKPPDSLEKNVWIFKTVGENLILLLY